MKYSVFYHHICRAAAEKGCTVAEMLAEVCAMGICYAELDRDALGAQDAQILAIGQQLADAGMQPSSIYGFYDWAGGGLPQEDDLLIRQAELLNCPRIMVIPGFYTDLADADKCRAEQANMIAGTKRLVELAAAKGLTVTIECFDNASSPIAAIEGMAEFLRAIPQLMITLETGNFIFSGDDVLEAQQRFGERVRHVHLKDRVRPALAKDVPLRGEPVTAATGEVLYPCAVGGGQMPIAEVIAGLRQADYEGIMTIEHFGVASFGEAIRASIAWLKAREVCA